MLGDDGLFQNFLKYLAGFEKLVVYWHCLSFSSQAYAFWGDEGQLGRSLEVVAPRSWKVLSFLPVELMWFWFKVMGLRRLKMWCKFFQVMLSQLYFLTQGVDDTVANTGQEWYHCVYHFLSGRCGCRIFPSTPTHWFLHCLPTLVLAQLPQDHMVTWISEQAPIPG